MPFALKEATRSIALAFGLAALVAPAARSADLKVDVTGSNIKRVEGETGQPH